MYNYEEIKNNLTTKYIAQTFVQFDELTSIHLKAKNICSNCPNGMLILSKNQENIKLKNNKYWFNVNGENLCMSLILKNNNKTDYSSEIMQIANVAIFEALKNLSATSNLTIKWPNDIIAGNKKISSTFTEYINKKESECNILTIYLNFSIDETEQNENIVDKFITLQDLTKENFDKELFISNILNKIEIYYDELLSKRTLNGVLDVFRKNNCILGNMIGVRKPNKKTIKTVKALDINNHGQIITIDKDNNKGILTNNQDIIEWWADDKKS